MKWFNPIRSVIDKDEMIHKDEMIQSNHRCNQKRDR